MPAVTTAETLREMLAQERTWFIPACFDALSARLAQQAGFPFCFVSGYGISATRLGMPDIGLISATEMADTMRYICNAVSGYPLIADGDQGYGNAMNVRRTVVDFARAGAAAIMLEDQVHPKKCGHFAHKQVVAREEACMKIRAAVEGRRDAGVDILIMARTDALSVLGFEEALQRMFDFQREGADILFMEALETEQQMETFCRSMTKPTWGNNFQGGRTPYLARERLQQIGFNVVTDPTLLFSATRTMQLHLRAFANGDDASIPARVSFKEMSEVMGLPAQTALERRYQTGE